MFGQVMDFDVHLLIIMVFVSIPLYKNLTLIRYVQYIPNPLSQPAYQPILHLGIPSPFIPHVCSARNTACHQCQAQNTDHEPYHGLGPHVRLERASDWDGNERPMDMLANSKFMEHVQSWRL